MKRPGKVFAAFVIAVVLIAGILFLRARTPVLHEGVPHGSSGPMPVEITIARPETVQVWQKFSSHVVAVDQAEIRPQVSGRITEIRFEDGAQVNKGDTLFVIDPRPFEAALQEAQAALSGARTQADLTEKQYVRAQELIGSAAVSRRVLDERAYERQAALSAVEAAQARVAAAKIDLDYAYVKAPIPGKTSRAEITEGNLVEAGPGAPLLTRIVSSGRVYVDFEVDEQTYIDSVRLASGGTSRIPVRLNPGNEGSPAYEGYVHSFDNRIDPSSGTVRARALFENAESVLLPGMTVSVEMGSVGDAAHILIPERAIGTDQSRKFVYVVDGEGMATYRQVEIGESVNGRRIILSGLEEGEKVVTEGTIRIRPGMPVQQKTEGPPATPEEKNTPAPPAESLLPEAGGEE